MTSCSVSKTSCSGYNLYVTILTEQTTMPIFEYVCQECDHHFEAIVLGQQKARCPKCESRKLAQQISKFAVSTESAAQPRAADGACGACGDPRGPGACSMN